jgi:ligand-binding sensor domain-containing protein
MVATAGEGVLLFAAGPAAGGTGSFRQLRPDASEMRDVTALLPLPTGDLLVGTRRAGLLLYSGTTLGKFRAETTGVPITALADDGAGGFWIGTRDRGALHWTGGTMEPVNTAAGLPDDQVESLLVRGADVFVGTPVGVAEVRDGKVVRRLAEGSFAHTLAFAKDGNTLAVGTMTEGVVKIPLNAAGSRRGIAASAGLAREATEAQPVVELLASGPDVYEVLADSFRRSGAGEGWESVVSALAGALTDGNISALAFAPDGRLWVGYFDHGLDILGAGVFEGTAPHDEGRGKAGTRTEHLEDDAVFCVNRLMVDPRRNTMVAATANGLVLFDAQGRERQVLTRRDGLIADHVTDVAATRRGLALATPAGLTFMDAEGTQSLYGFQGLVNNHVYALGVQPDGDEMLAGTLGGVSVLAAESVQRNMTVANSGLRHNWVTAVVPMPDGGWMVGTYGAGVMRMDKDGHFAPMDIDVKTTKAGHETVINPNAMLATSDHVFAGSLGQGLWVYTRATDRWRQRTEGLPSGNVTALLEHQGEIYVGTENGLVRIAERAVDEGATP